MSTDAAARTAPEERVHQFMLDYDEKWLQAASAFEKREGGSSRAAFALWRELIGQVTQEHFLDPGTADLASSFGRPPSHGPQAETLVGSEIHGDLAYVQTTTGPPLSRTNEYTLQGQDGDWRIVAIDDHYGDPTQPFLDASAADERRSACGPDAPLAAMPTAQARLDEMRNFTEREVEGLQEGSPTQVRVSAVGTLVTTSGVLVAHDFGYGNNDAHPLARTVPPGSYPVDRVTAAGRNAALRVRFSDKVPSSWSPAGLPGGGHVFGVDAGSACIVDYVAYTAMSRREKAAQYRRFTAAERPAALEVPLGGADVGIVADSGYGDGSYPAYWGLDAEGRTAQLVIDFLILTTYDEDGVLRHR
jgi:hypothetical protein